MVDDWKAANTRSFIKLLLILAFFFATGNMPTCSRCKVSFLEKHADFHQTKAFFINDYIQYVNSKILSLLMIYQYF